MHALRRFIRSGHTENLGEKFSKKKKKKGILIAIGNNADFPYLSSVNTFSVIFNLHCFYHNPSMCLP